MGYAFINFKHTKYIPEFYLEFNNRGWDKFNSKKVVFFFIIYKREVQIAVLRYARIQGLAELKSHFYNTIVASHQVQFSLDNIIINYVKNWQFTPWILEDGNDNEPG